MKKAERRLRDTKPASDDSTSDCRRPRVGRPVVSFFAILSIAFLAARARATEFHVRIDGSDASCNGLANAPAAATPACAFAGVQRGLNVMKGRDTLWIHQGTYTGNFNCCGHGDSSIEAALGTGSQPTRVLGWPGDTVILRGGAGQARPTISVWGQTNLATLTFRCGNGGDCTSGVPHATYVEIGNLTIRSGYGAAITIPRGERVYLHDLRFDDQSLYLGGAGSAAEDTGLIWLHLGQFIFADNIVVNSSADPIAGTRRPVILFNCGVCREGRFRMIDMADIEQGGLEAKHGRASTTWEFIKVRNWTPWRLDDGALNDIYNSSVTTMRYISVAEAPGAGGPIWGYVNARRTDCINSAGPNSLYVTNMHGEDDAHGPDNYGMVGMTASQSNGCMIHDLRIYNSVAERFTTGILSIAAPAGGASCNMFHWDYNAFVNVITPLDYGGTGCNVSIGPHSLQTASVPETDHRPQSASPLIDAGVSDTFAGTPWFPPPAGGGSRIDIGAYEYNAGNWPYEFDVIASVIKNPALQDITICWGTGVAGCAATIPLWDPWVQTSAARSTAPDWYQVQIDPANHFHSGNGVVSKGFGAFHDSGAVNSANRYYVVPSGVLQDSQQYYVQVRVAENNVYMAGGSDSLGSNGGWGPWSVGFYRFEVNSSGMQPPTNLRIVR